METNEVYKQIKKQNGESFAKVIRENNLLNINGIVDILEFAGRNPLDAENLVYYLLYIQRKQQGDIEYKKVDNVDPFDLLKQAGYDAFLADTEEKQNSIKPYFRPKEELCTFKDKTRYKQFYIIHAVKTNAKDIKPAQNPDREDEYGTSVISIQIAKQGGFISIKNRYNHSVNDPDRTFNNNPDIIIPGLTDALQKYFGVFFEMEIMKIPDNYRLLGNQAVRYNYVVNDLYFGENYYFNGGKITKIDKNKELVMDYFVLDKQQGKLLNPSKVPDSFVDVFNDEIRGKNIKTTKDKDTSETIILTVDKDTKQEREVARVLNGCITSLCLNAENIGNYFLFADTTIEKLDFPKLKSVDNEFLENNISITMLNAPELKTVGDWFLYGNASLDMLELPKLVSTGNYFLADSLGPKKVALPKLNRVGDSFFWKASFFEKLSLPELQVAGDMFGRYCRNIKKLELPKLEIVGDDFLHDNTELTELWLPNLQSVGNGFLCKNTVLKKLKLPKLRSVGNWFMGHNKKISKLYLPQLQEVGKDFFSNNENIKKASAGGLKFENVNKITELKKGSKSILQKIKKIVLAKSMTRKTER